jgi:hypothetical protein
LRKWNAIQLVEEYYEEGLERLIEALSPQLGPPRTQEGIDQVEVQRKLKQLRGEAEAALAVEDWLAGIQALQAAVSLDPNSADLSTRLRWAHEQHKASGLFAEGQHLYEQGKKEAALGRYRQASLVSSHYRNVTQLIARLETELASDSRRSNVRRWTAGAVAAVVIAVAAAGSLIIWVVRSEFDTDAASTETPFGLVGPGMTDVGGSPDPPAAGSGARAPVTGAAATPQRLAGDGPVSEQRAQGPGFPGRGRWRMTSQEDRTISIALALDSDGSFEVSMPAGVLDLPLSGGNYSYNDSTGTIEIMGVNNLGAMFRETIHVFEREDDHFHANYLGTVWELEADD